MKRLGLIFAAIVVAIMLLVVGGVALAAPSSVPDAGSVQTDGRVWTILRLGDRVYLGGDFTHVNGVVRNRLAAINATTGKLTNWNPNANGSVRTLAASQDGARLYAGGAFTAVFGQSRPYLVGLDAANTGATVWRPLTNPNGAIFDVVARGANVYGAEGGSGGPRRPTRLPRVFRPGSSMPGATATFRPSPTWTATCTLADISPGFPPKIGDSSPPWTHRRGCWTRGTRVVVALA